MTTQKSNKVRLLWVAEMEFDVQHDTCTWLEMISHLQESCALRLLTGYRHMKVQPKVLHNKIIYYDATKTPYVKREN